jgi:hypothetical protein
LFDTAASGRLALCTGFGGQVWVYAARHHQFKRAREQKTAPRTKARFRRDPLLAASRAKHIRLLLVFLEQFGSALSNARRLKVVGIPPTARHGG